MDIDVILESDIRCHRCGGQLLLLVRVPHNLQHRDVRTAERTRTIGLCESCDREEMTAQGVLAFFSRYDVVTDINTETFALLIQEWVSRVMDRPPPGNLDQQSYQDFLKWQDGDL